MTDIKAVIKREHTAGCFAIQRDTPWCLDYRDPHVSADVRGNSTGRTTSWIRVRCLDPSCTALMLVREWELWMLADAAATQ